MKQEEIFQKVLTKDDKVRYINQSGKWYFHRINGKFMPSRPMKIKKVYGTYRILLEVDEIFGIRLIKFLE